MDDNNEKEIKDETRESFRDERCEVVNELLGYMGVNKEDEEDIEERKMLMMNKDENVTGKKVVEMMNQSVIRFFEVKKSLEYIINNVFYKKDILKIEVLHDNSILVTIEVGVGSLECKVLIAEDFKYFHGCVVKIVDNVFMGFDEFQKMNYECERFNCCLLRDYINPIILNKGRC